MSTRAAAKREAAFLAEASLSSPPVTPEVKSKAAATKPKGQRRSKKEMNVAEVTKKFVEVDDRELHIEAEEGRVQLLSPAEGGEIPDTALPTGSKKRKRASAKTKKVIEPVKGGWDVLPHGIGKKGDLVDDSIKTEDNAVPRLPKRARRGKVAQDLSEKDETTVTTDDMIKDEAQDEGNATTGVESASEEAIAWSKLSIHKLKSELEKHGLPKSGKKADLIARLDKKDNDPITTELLGGAEFAKIGENTKAVKSEDVDMDEQVKAEFSEDGVAKKTRGRKTRVVREDNDSDEDMKDEDFQEGATKKKRAPRRKATLATSNDVLQKVDEMLDASVKAPKAKKEKKNPYGLTPGFSPFPDFVKPTPEDCEEVVRLLSKLHGEVKPPDVIPPPSMEVTGCGEVPDLLDATIRTLLSASTTANNSNMALKGLKDKFGLRTSGVGEGSINWEAVYEAGLDTVIDAIKSGGLAKVKGTNIKKILDAVWKDNIARRDALVKEKETGTTADITGAKHEPQKGKDLEIAKVNDNMLSMDYVFELTTDEAMIELTKLPGIGVKTASCVILFCMKRPSFAVDTHVWRHCKWLEWVPANATRDQTFSHCEVRIPDHLKYPLHALFLRHGKTCGRCRAATSADSEEFKNAECPIDHLMNRTEKKKMIGAKSGAGTQKKAAGKGVKKTRKGKKADDTEESEAEMSEHDESDTDEVDGVEDREDSEE